MSPGSDRVVMVTRKQSRVAARSSASKASRLGGPVVPDVLTVTMRATASWDTHRKRRGAAASSVRAGGRQGGQGVQRGENVRGEPGQPFAIKGAAGGGVGDGAAQGGQLPVGQGLRVGIGPPAADGGVDPGIEGRKTHVHRSRYRGRPSAAVRL